MLFSAAVTEIFTTLCVSPQSDERSHDVRAPPAGRIGQRAPPRRCRLSGTVSSVRAQPPFFVSTCRPCVLLRRTPLMLAVAGGHVDAVSLLLEREASVNMADSHGLTALHLGVSV